MGHVNTYSVFETGNIDTGEVEEERATRSQLDTKDQVDMLMVMHVMRCCLFLTYFSKIER